MKISSFLWSSLCVGLLSFGGGKAFIPIYQKLYVSSYHIISGSTLNEYIGYALAFPGPISPMVTGLVGFFGWGFYGFLLGILILTIPPLLLVSLAYFFLSRYHEKPLFQFINFYMQAGILGLLCFVIGEFFLPSLLVIGKNPLLLVGLSILIFIFGFLERKSTTKKKKFPYIFGLLFMLILGALILPFYRSAFLFLFLGFISFYGMVLYKIHPLLFIVLGSIIGILWFP